MDLNTISRYRNQTYGFCALWIVLYHAASAHGCDFSIGLDCLKPVQSFILLGNVGVDIFLLLSGISLYSSWTKHPDLHRFIKRRLGRIIPVTLIICLPIWVMWCGQGLLEWSRLLFNISLIPPLFAGAGGIWFVPAVILFYFAYPYIHIFIYGGGYIENQREKILIRRSLFLVICSLMLFWIIHRFFSSSFSSTEIMWSRIPDFIIGCYLGHLVMDGDRKIKRDALFLVAVCCFIYCFVVLGNDALKSIWWWRLLLLPAGMFGVLLIPQVFQMLANSTFASFQLLVKFFSLVGAISLEIYVAHSLFYSERGIFPPINGRVTTALILGIASVAYAVLANALLKYIKKRRKFDVSFNR